MSACQTFIARLLKTLSVNFTSRKFWMTVMALWIEWSAYWVAISLIYTFKTPDQLNAFVSVTQHFQWATTTILLGYLGIQTMNNFSNAATQATQNLVQNAVSFTKSEHKEERIYKCEKLDPKDIPDADEH